MVAAVEGGCDRGGMGRISDDSIKIDDCVESLVGPNPVIDGLTLRLLVGREVTDIGTVRQGIFEGRQRTGDDLEAAQMRPLNQLLVAGNNSAVRAMPLGSMAVPGKPISLIPTRMMTWETAGKLKTSRS